MNLYTIRNWSTGEELLIKALHWEIEQKTYQHTFYLDVEGKIITCSFTTRYWDIRNIEYEVSSS